MLAWDPAFGQQDAGAKARATIRAAIEALDRNDSSRCIALLRQAKQLDPELAEARLYLALVLVYADPGAQHLEAARELEELLAKKPDHVVARLHLGLVRASLYMPGDPSDKNRREGEQSVAEFRRVLERDPNNWLALHAAGAQLFNLGINPFDAARLVEAKQLFLRHISLRTDYRELYYWVGVIDWWLAFRGNQTARADYNAKAPKPVKYDEPLPPNVRKEFAAKYGPFVDEGIQVLKKAMQPKDYADAEAYLNTLYRLKADTVESMDDRKQYLKMANDLLKKHCGTGEKNNMKPQQSPEYGQHPQEAGAARPRGEKPRLLALADFEIPSTLEALLVPPPAPPCPPPAS